MPERCRRSELIHKKYESYLTEIEKDELERLQAISSKFLSVEMIPSMEYVKKLLYGDNVMSKLKKSEIIEKVATKLGLSNKDAEAAVEAVADTVRDILGAGDIFAWPGFATLTPKTVPAKSGTAPNGEAWSKPASIGVKFKAAPALKNALNG